LEAGRRKRLSGHHLEVGAWFNRTKEPFFKMGMALQLLGVRQYFTSSFKFKLRNRLLCEDALRKENMLSREERNKNLAATVLSESA
tara:strand:+ start:339 stop:596 length:258 start_codon:yes stop_codon:yes gene_type:complete